MSRGHERGFSLIELLIALLVLVQVMGAILLLFTSLSDLSRVQTDVAEMQHSQRIGQRTMVELVRDAGFGGLPATVREAAGAPGEFPDGLAVKIINNVPNGFRIAGAGSDEVLEGSDVLVIRGVFSAPIYYFEPQWSTRDDIGGDAVSLLDASGANFTVQGETLQIPETFGKPFRTDRIFQSLTPLVDALTEDPVRVLILRDLLNPGAYALVETSGFQDDRASACDCVTVTVNLSSTSKANEYADLMAGSPLTPGTPGSRNVEIGGAGRLVAFPRNIGAVGILDEMHFYLRVDTTRELLLANSTSKLPALVLSRVSIRPGSEDQIGGRVDIADNLLDLQLAAGVDTSPLNTPGRGQIFDDGSDLDEVWFNHKDDVPVAFTAANNNPQIHFLRVTTLVHAGRPERGHRARTLASIEDADRGGVFSIGGVTFDYNTSLANYRRRPLTTVIDLRNVR